VVFRVVFWWGRDLGQVWFYGKRVTLWGFLKDYWGVGGFVGFVVVLAFGWLVDCVMWRLGVW